MTGEVIEALPNTQFNVKSDGTVYRCYLAGRMRINRIKVMVGDRVEFISLDGKVGRINRRINGK